MLVFDPNVKHDANNKEFKKLHEEYKNLVDFMLGSFMEELQITPEQFEVACLEGRNVSDASSSAKRQDNTFSFHQGLFQQIWAANDIRIFIKMMVQRNLEIQLQALDLIERQQVSTSSSQSKGETAQVEADDVLNEGLYNDGKIPDEIKLPEENEVVLSTMQMIEEKLNGDNKNSPTIEQTQHPLGEKMQDQLKEYDINEKFKRLNLFFENEKIDTQEVKQRQEYLRAQRDKILQIKKQVRARQLNETVKKTGRPQSASATAAKILLEEGSKEHLAAETKPEASAQLRITLAKRLRAEVIDAEGQTA